MNEERRLPDAGGIGRGDVCTQPQNPTYEIKIHQAENGFIVVVGCKTFVFSEWVLASEGLALYFKSPVEAYKKYCKC